MSNLLPKQRRIILNWQSRVRVMVIVTLMLLLGMLVIAASLLPFAIYARVVHSERVTQGAGMVQPTEEEDVGASAALQRQALLKSLKVDNNLLEHIKETKKLHNVYDIVLAVERHADSILGIELHNVTVDANKKEPLYIVRLSGRAASRTVVVSLRDVFEHSARFDVIDFPISNLTPTLGEYTFSILLHSSEITKTVYE